MILFLLLLTGRAPVALLSVAFLVSGGFQSLEMILSLVIASFFYVMFFYQCEALNEIHDRKNFKALNVFACLALFSLMLFVATLNLARYNTVPILGSSIPILLAGVLNPVAAFWITRNRYSSAS